MEESMQQMIVNEVGIVAPQAAEATPYDPSADPLHPYGKDCSICSTEFDDNEWGIMGWLGILPVSLCVNCMTGIYNMVFQMTSVEELQSLIEEKQADDTIVESPAKPLELTAN
jgi:hypothetical protein